MINKMGNRQTEFLRAGPRSCNSHSHNNSFWDEGTSMCAAFLEVEGRDRITDSHSSKHDPQQLTACQHGDAAPT
jgi:hypothetical protein